MGGNPRLSGYWSVNRMVCRIETVDLTSLPPADGILSERERSYFEKLRFPKRRTEWLGGRFALKKAICGLLPISRLDLIEVLPTEGGKPCLSVKGEKSSLAFSISHSHGFAVAAVSQDDDYIGIDLEKIEHRIEAWAQDFFHPSELSAREDKALTALWTQKEALVKLLGKGLCLNSYDVRFVKGKAEFYGEAHKEYVALGEPEISMQTREYPAGFMLSLASGKKRR